jgi:ribosome-binding ATPase YchF (GTP1/OBG family)
MLPMKVLLKQRYLENISILLVVRFFIKEKGLWRLEGKEYVVKEGDIMVFKFNV